MSQYRRREGRSGFTTLAAAYGLLLVLIIMTIYAFTVWRRAVLAMLAEFLQGNFANTAVFQFSLVLIMMVMFGLVIAAETYLRRGAERFQLTRRFVRIAVPLLAFCILGLVLQTVFENMVRSSSP